LTGALDPNFEETLEVVVKGDWGFISVVHQRHHIPLYGFKERDFVLLHTFKKLEDGTCMCLPLIELATCAPSLFAGPQI
jgi:hypothetical protein